MITVDSISSEPFYFAGKKFSLKKMKIFEYFFIVFIILCSHCFYCVHWVSYVTGTLHFGIFDVSNLCKNVYFVFMVFKVTEIQFAAMGVFTMTAMFGQEIWKFTPLFGFPLR